MSKKLYIYSTLAADVNYTNFVAGGADIPTALEPVHIKGGTGVIDGRMVTNHGAVVTEVTEEQLEYLRANSVFQIHEKNNFIQVSDELVDVEVAAADMDRDPSAPMTPHDLKDEDKPAGADADAPAPTPTKAKGGKK